MSARPVALGARLARSLPRPSPRAVLVGTLVLALLIGGYLWLRDSSLVAVNDIEVTGAGGDERLVAELERVASGMTTMHVREDDLDRVAAAFPAVRSVDADPSFPHGMKIEVTLRDPAGAVRTGDGRVAVAADGTLLPGVATDEAPTMVAGVGKSGERLDQAGVELAAVLGAVPDPLRGEITGASADPESGPTVELTGGIEVRFGDGSRPGAKWASAAAVLADESLDAASYVDVTAPRRPAAGTGEPPAPTTETDEPAAETDEAPAPTADTAPTDPEGMP